VPAATLKPTAVRWPVPAALAVAPLVLGVLVSFSSDHSARYGLIVLAIFAGATAVASVVGAVLLPAGSPRLGAGAKAVLGALGAIAAGIGAAAVGDAAAGAGAATTAWTAAGVLALLAVVDLVVGIRRRRADRFGRDWITLGVLEALTAVVVVLVPSEYDYQYTVSDKGGLNPVHLDLTSSVIVVGLLGAGLAIIGVYLAIAAVSLMSGRKRAESATEVTA